MPRIRAAAPARCAAGYYADHWVPLVDAETHRPRCAPRAVVVATGAFEQPAVFRNNDLPGIMLASAAQRLMHRYAVQPASARVVLDGERRWLRRALDLLDAGVEVAAVVDLRAAPSPIGRSDGAARRGIECARAATPSHEAHAGQRRASPASTLSPLDADGAATGTRGSASTATASAMSVGWAPAAALLLPGRRAHALRRGACSSSCPPRCPPACSPAAGSTASYALDARLADGERAGSAAAAHARLAACADGASAIPPRAERRRRIRGRSSRIRRARTSSTSTRTCSSRTSHNAVQEGFDNIELLKRYTTVGMGPSQGKHSNMNAMRILARMRGAAVGAGRHHHRAAVLPSGAAGASGGPRLQPERRTPLHARHAALGAVWMPAGDWLRPEYYARAGQDARAMPSRAEVRAVRAAASA